MMRWFMWPPLALARWVNNGPGRTSLDRAFYSALYSAGWVAIWATVAIVLVTWAVQAVVR